MCKTPIQSPKSMLYDERSDYHTSRLVARSIHMVFQAFVITTLYIRPVKGVGKPNPAVGLDIVSIYGITHKGAANNSYTSVSGFFKETVSLTYSDVEQTVSSSSLRLATIPQVSFSSKMPQSAPVSYASSASS